MLVKFFQYLLNFFNAKELPPEEVTTTTETAKSPIALNPWPYSWNEPTPEILMALLEGTVIDGDHVFYFSKLHEKTTLRIDKTYSNARTISHWIGGLENPNASPILSNCGESTCIKLDHLKILIPKDKVVHTPKKKTVAQGVEKEVPGNRTTVGPKKPTEDDRNLCQTAKIHYPSERRARDAQSYYNFWNRRNHSRKKSYVYDCYLCDGWHLTSSNPNKRHFKPTGSW